MQIFGIFWRTFPFNKIIFHYECFLKCLKKLGRRKYGIYKHERKTTGEGMFVDKDKM